MLEDLLWVFGLAGEAAELCQVCPEVIGQGHLGICRI